MKKTEIGLAIFKGLTDVLIGKKTFTSQDEIVAPGGVLPTTLEIHIDRLQDIYRPTCVSYIKLDPYVGVYMASNKMGRQFSPAKQWGGSNCSINYKIVHPFVSVPV